MRTVKLRPQDVAAATIIAQVFVVYLAVLQVVAPAQASHWAHADPILLILSPEVTLALVPALSVLLALTWWRWAKPDKATLRRALWHAAAGLAAGLVAIGLLRLVTGPVLPTFIPAEESAKPGFLLSMTAGYGEEVILRMALLPALLFGLARRLSRPAIITIAVVATGLAFALLHEPGQEAFNAQYFITRVLVPGCAMSLAFIYISPAFLIVAHASAHLLIPALFV